MTDSSSLKNCEIESPPTPPSHPEMIFINHSSKLGENSEGKEKKTIESLQKLRNPNTLSADCAWL